MKIGVISLSEKLEKRKGNQYSLKKLKLLGVCQDKLS